MKHVLIIKPDGTLKLRRWPKREEQLDFLQELVGDELDGLDQQAATLMMGHLFELKTEEVTA